MLQRPMARRTPLGMQLVVKKPYIVAEEGYVDKVKHAATRLKELLPMVVIDR